MHEAAPLDDAELAELEARGHPDPLILRLMATIRDREQHKKPFAYETRWIRVDAVLPSPWRPSEWVVTRPEGPRRAWWKDPAKAATGEPPWESTSLADLDSEPPA